MKEFRYLRREMRLHVGDEEIEATDGDDWAAPLELVADASLASFRRAVLSMVDHFPNTRPVDSPWGPGHDYRSLTVGLGHLYLSDATIDDFDIEYSTPLETSISVLLDNSTSLDVEVDIRGINLDEDDYPIVLKPLLDRLGTPLLEHALHAAGNQGVLVLRVAYGPRGASIRDAANVGQSIAMFVSSMRDGELTPDGVLGILTAGRADLLLGLPESNWLEVKQQGYDLATGLAPKIELAQDVARFANGDVDAILVIGYQTSKDKQTGEETIGKVTPALAAYNAQQYHQVIDNRVFPPVLGLTVEGFTVPLRGGRQGHLLAIRVPAQPEESKPFLVHGAIVDGRVEGAFISIVQRRGEHSVPTRPETIHGTLAAGRALLRRGVVPPTDG